MPAASLGNRLTCGACSARFYDLNRPEPSCPKCKTVYDGSKAFSRPAPAPEPDEVEDEFDDEEGEDDDEVEELDLDTDHMPAPLGGGDDDEEDGDPALDELDETDLPDDSLGGYGDDDD